LLDIDLIDFKYAYHNVVNKTQASNLTMTLIYVKDEKRTIKSLCTMIDNAPRMDVFRLEEVDLDGTKGNIIVLSKALREHPCLEESHLTSVTLTDSSLTLDQVISVIMDSVPDLIQVKLEKVPVSSSALATAGYSTSLKTPMDGHPCLEEFRMTSTTLAEASLSLDEVISMILDLVSELRHDELETLPVSSSALAVVAVVPQSELDDKDAVKPAKADAQSPSIESNEIRGNDVSDLRCDAFAKSLDKNSSVHLEGDSKISSVQRTQVETTSPKRAGGKAHAA
jgi:hypothetical protein